MPVAVEQRGAPPNGLRRAWEQGRKRRKGVNPRSRPWVASIDAAGAQVREPPRWELEPRRFPQCSLARMPHALVQIPPFRCARPEFSAASMDASVIVVRAQHPLCLLWPSSGRIVRRRLAAKATKGSNPRSVPCVASIDAAGLRCGSRQDRGSNRGAPRCSAVPARRPRALVQRPPFRPLALNPPRRLWTPPGAGSGPSALCAFCGPPPVGSSGAGWPQKAQKGRIRDRCRAWRP